MNNADLKDLVIELQRENQTLQLQQAELLAMLENAKGFIELVPEANEPGEELWALKYEMGDVIERAKGDTDA